MINDPSCANAIVKGDNRLLQWDFLVCWISKYCAFIIWGYSIRYQNFRLEIWIKVLFEFLKSDYPSKSYEHLKFMHLLLPHFFSRSLNPFHIVE